MTQPAICVTTMRKRHARAALVIERLVNPKPWSLEVLHSELGLAETRAYFVAMSDRTVVGFAGLMMAVDDGHVTNIAVHPNWQRQRIASRLLVALTRAAIERGATALTLEVRLSNKGAQQLYRHFGFAPVGVRKRYYQQPEEDALIMWAHDIQRAEYCELVAALESQLPEPVVVLKSRRVSSNEGFACNSVADL